METLLHNLEDSQSRIVKHICKEMKAIILDIFEQSK